MLTSCVYFSHHAGHPEFFARGLLVAIRSVRLTNPSLPVFVLHNGLTAAEQSSLEGCHLIRVDGRLFSAAHRPDLTPATFFKFYLDELHGFDRVLYLDSDLVVLDSLNEIFRTPGALLARRQACDLTEDYVDPREVTRREGMHDDGPFLNGGVVCFDRRFWMRERLLDGVMGIAAEYGWPFFKNADQGILNILAHRSGGFVELPRAYNYCRWPDMVTSRVVRLSTNGRGWQAPMILEDTVQRRLVKYPWLSPFVRRPLAKIVHWNGPGKPWEFHDEADRHRFVWRCYEQIAGCC